MAEKANRPTAQPANRQTGQRAYRLTGQSAPGNSTDEPVFSISGQLASEPVSESAPAKALRRITVGSYNIHSCVGLDRRCSPQRIATVLKELACDIYALQEVDNEPDERDDSKQLEYLSAELGMAAAPGLRIVRHSGQYGNAILTRLPIVSVHRLDLSYPWFEPRGALDVRLDGGEAVLRVIATHLGLSRAERRAQWRQLLTAVATASRTLPTIVVGDMNEWFPWSMTLRDAHRILGRPIAAPAEFPSLAPFLALTRIWVRPANAIASIEAHSTPTARRASDHLPLKAVIDLGMLREGTRE
jgi:endonuclease/exonuclease/phosphatase family metal-dependent hydrolase